MWCVKSLMKPRWTSTITSGQATRASYRAAGQAVQHAGRREVGREGEADRLAGARAGLDRDRAAAAVEQERRLVAAAARQRVDVRLALLELRVERDAVGVVQRAVGGLDGQ